MSATVQSSMIFDEGSAPRVKVSPYTFSSPKSPTVSATKYDVDTFVSQSPKLKRGVATVGFVRVTLGASAAAITFSGTLALAAASAYAAGFLAHATYASFMMQTSAPAAQLVAVCFWAGATTFAAAICLRVVRDVIFFGGQFKDLYTACKAEGAAAARHLAHANLSWPCAKRTLLFASAAMASAALSLHPVASASLAAMAVGYGTLSLLSFTKGPAPKPTSAG